MARYLALVNFILALFVICQGVDVVVEKGHSTNITCTFATTATSVTWYRDDIDKLINISSCSLANNKCSDVTPSLYQGYISTTSGVTVVGLTIVSARVNETTFKCVTNNGQQNTTQLDVYAWPKTPVCVQTITNDYLQINCTTDNVYYLAVGDIYRIEVNLTNTDFLPESPIIHIGSEGSGSEGDYKTSWAWRIYVTKLLPVNTFYVEMTALASNNNQTMINNPPAVSNDIMVSLRPPVVALSQLNCPIGPGVGGNAILNGTKANCTCELSPAGVPPGYARWFTNDNRTVGYENTMDGSSTITVSSSDPNQSYECRGFSVSYTNFTSTRYTPKFTSCFATVEKGQATNLQCDLQNDVTNVTWQFMSGSNMVSLSNCIFPNNTCTDSMAPLYQSQASNSTGNKITTLNIANASTTETQFVCLTNNGQRVQPRCSLEVYDPPTKPNCVQNLTDMYVDINCTTAKVYPAINTVIQRREISLSSDDIEPGYPKYTLYPGSDGEYSESGVWRIPISRMIPNSNISVEMTARIYNTSLASITAVTSDGIITNFSVPVVHINDSNCPVGPSVRGTKLSMTDSATCKCELRMPGMPPGFARWYNKENKMTGVENMMDGSSTLTIKYSDKDEVFHCRPVTVLRANVEEVTYTPQFYSSASHFGLQPLVIAHGALCAWLILPFINS